MQLPTSLPHWLSSIPNLFRVPYVYFRVFVQWIKSWPGFQILLLSRFLTAAPIAGWGVFVMILPTLIWYVVSILGFTAITYLGVHVAVDTMVNIVQSKTAILPPAVFSIMGIMQLDVGFKMIVSAGLVKLILRGWNSLSGAYRSWWWKPRMEG